MHMLFEIPSELSSNYELYDSIAEDIKNKGYSIKPCALPMALATKLYKHLMQMEDKQFHKAGIGRDHHHLKSQFVRTDEICWINGDSESGKEWLEWTDGLKHHLNQKLFLGLFSFESHFAHYKAGDFYKRHLDAFKGEANRILTIVVYLNPGWIPEYGGELVIYPEKKIFETDEDAIKVIPLLGTVVTFLSEEFPHEVLPANTDRYSIAGWFRLNASNLSKVDPDR